MIEVCRLPRRLSGKESACNIEDAGSVPRLENPLGREMATHSSILFFFFFLKILFIFGSAGSSLLHGLFSSCREWGPL